MIDRALLASAILVDQSKSGTGDAVGGAHLCQHSTDEGGFSGSHLAMKGHDGAIFQSFEYSLCRFGQFIERVYVNLCRHAIF